MTGIGPEMLFGGQPLATQRYEQVSAQAPASNAKAGIHRKAMVRTVKSRTLAAGNVQDLAISVVHPIRRSRFCISIRSLAIAAGHKHIITMKGATGPWAGALRVQGFESLAAHCTYK